MTLKDHPYNVVQMEGENRFFVNSKSRPGLQHIVDMMYQEEPHSRPKPACSCEAFLANKHTKGQYCQHIKAVADHLGKRLGMKA